MAQDFIPQSSANGLPGPHAAVPRTVEAGRGATWWSESWRLFKPAVGPWLLIMVVGLAVNVAFAFVPYVGQLAGQILYPLLVAGLMLGCRAIDSGAPLTINHLFAGFTQRTGPLLMLGVIYTAVALGIALVVFGIVAAVFGTAAVTALLNSGDDLSMGMALGGLLFATLVGLLLFLALLLPLIMAIWFAPALVMLRGVEPVAALKLSFAGCMQNMMPFLVYGAIGLLLAIVATIPFGLGWLVLGPMTTASIYTSYCDIFEDQAPAV